MSVDYKHFQFAGVPRSGSTWFMKACDEVGLGRGFKAHVHTPFSDSSEHILRVSLVRHPYNWLESYYKEIYPGNTGVEAVDVLAVDKEADTFVEFVSTYLNHYPGQVGRIFNSYNADVYLRIEDMPWAATELFASIDIPAHIRNKCRRITPQNQSRVHIPKTMEVYRAVMEAEEPIVEQYEYF